MTTEHLSRPLVGDRLVDRWTQLYTRRLDDETARARRDEIASDRYDHIAAARAAGLTSAATSRALAARMLLGVPADLSWRRHHLRDERRAERKEKVMSQSAARGGAHVVAAIAGVLVVGWIVLGVALSTIYVLDNDVDANWWSAAVVAIVAAVGILGLIRLARGRSSGAFLLAGAAVGSTIWLFWAPLIPLVGLAFAAGFIAYGMSIRAASDSVGLEPVQG